MKLARSHNLPLSSDHKSGHEMTISIPGFR